MEAQLIENMQEHEDIVSKKQFSVISIIYLAVGAALFVIYNQLTDPSQSSLRLSVMVLMVIALSIGVFKLLSGKKQLVLKTDGTPVKQQTVFFDPRDSMRLQTLLDQKKYSDINQLKHFKEDNSGVKLAALFSANGQYAAIQLSEYKPFAYDAISDIKTYRNEDASSIVQCITTLSAQN